MLWDVRYSVLLTERRHPLPHYLSDRPLDNLQLKLAIASKSLALLVVHPYITVAEKEKQTAVGVKSLVLSIPYAVPESSSLKNALGKAPFTQKWITSSKGDKPAGIHAAAEDILRRLAATLKEGRIERVEEAFFEWRETQAGHPEDGDQVNGTGDHEESDIGGKGRSKKVKPVFPSLQ